MRSVACVLCTLSLLLVFSSAAPAAEASSPRMNAGERAIVRAINRARASHGVRALRGHRRLARAAERRAERGGVADALRRLLADQVDEGLGQHQEGHGPAAYGRNPEACTESCSAG